MLKRLLNYCSENNDGLTTLAIVVLTTAMAVLVLGLVISALTGGIN